MPCGPDQPMIHAFAKRRNSPVGHEILAEDKGHDMLAEYRAGFWKYISVLFTVQKRLKQIGSSAFVKRKK
jgi:hypothetical protein